MPMTVAVATWVPPVAQVLGAVDCGPNTVKVIVPVAVLAAPDSVEPIAVEAIAVAVEPVAGAATVVVVTFLTVTRFVNPEMAVHARS